MKRKFSTVLIAVFFLSFFGPGFAGCKEAKKAEATAKKHEEKNKPAKQQTEGEEEPTGDVDKVEEKFFNLGFGYAVGVTMYADLRKSVEEAAIVNGIVRVLEEKSTTARLMLETHYFFPFPFAKKNDRIGFGPFLALEIMGKQFTTFGGGLLVGFRYSKESSRSFNLGFGWFHDQNFKKLGDGMYKNQPVPPGEYVVRYEITGWNGPLFIFSFSF